VAEPDEELLHLVEAWGGGVAGHVGAGHGGRMVDAWRGGGGVAGHGGGRAWWGGTPHLLQNLAAHHAQFHQWTVILSAVFLVGAHLTACATTLHTATHSYCSSACTWCR
jgi:hypothetical protein